MSTAVDRYIEAPLSERHQYAQALASAGDLIPKALFGPPTDGKPPAPSAGKVLLVIETGGMLGIHPIAALSSINIIEGKPAASAGLISGLIRGAGHKLRIRETGTIEGGDYSATATLVRSDDPDEPFTSTWTPQRAARAGLCKYAQNAKGVWEVNARSSRGMPLPWESFTESLCKARIVSEVGRDGAQDVLLGIRYTPEELGGRVDVNGEYDGEMIVLDSEGSEPVPAAPSAKPAARKQATNGTQGTKRPKAAAEPEPAATPEPVTPEPAAEDDTPAVLVPDEPVDAEAPAVPVEEIIDAELVDEPIAEPALTDEELEANEIRAHEAAEQSRMVAESEAGEPTTWDARLAAAQTVEQCRAIWEGAVAAGELTTELRTNIYAVKTAIETKLAA